MKKLVVYYSRADENYFNGEYRYIEVGNTEKIATMIEKITNADLFKIEQKNPYAADYKTCIHQAQEDKDVNARPELIHTLGDVDKYDEVYLGFPNYWGTMPMAVFTFLEKIDWNGKIIHPFVTHEGSGLGNSVFDIKRVCKGSEVTNGLAIKGSVVDSAQVTVENWVYSLLTSM